VTNDPSLWDAAAGAVVFTAALVGAWLSLCGLWSVLLRIFSGPSYDESANEQRGRDDDGW